MDCSTLDRREILLARGLASEYPFSIRLYHCQVGTFKASSTLADDWHTKFSEGTFLVNTIVFPLPVRSNMEDEYGIAN